MMKKKLWAIFKVRKDGSYGAVINGLDLNGAYADAKCPMLYASKVSAENDMNWLCMPSHKKYRKNMMSVKRVTVTIELE